MSNKKEILITIYLDLKRKFENTSFIVFILCFISIMTLYNDFYSYRFLFNKIAISEEMHSKVLTDVVNDSNSEDEDEDEDEEDLSREEMFEQNFTEEDKDFFAINSLEDLDYFFENQDSIRLDTDGTPLLDRKRLLYYYKKDSTHNKYFEKLEEYSENEFSRILTKNNLKRLESVEYTIPGTGINLNSWDYSMIVNLLVLFLFLRIYHLFKRLGELIYYASDIEIEEFKVFFLYFKFQEFKLDNIKTNWILILPFCTIFLNLILRIRLLYYFNSYYKDLVDLFNASFIQISIITLFVWLAIIVISGLIHAKVKKINRIFTKHFSDDSLMNNKIIDFKNENNE